ncbi:MAG: metallophosphoesterase [Lacunisphaera sp.]|nr:metallophosphoesterase [Lacunisphaera sp.]
MSFRILHTADLHGRIDWLRWLHRQAPEFDLVVIAGDLLDLRDDRRTKQKIDQISALLQSFPGPLAFCSGNHDPVPSDHGEEGPYWFRPLRRRNLWIDGDRFKLGGHDFHCLGWGNPVPPGRTGEVWITHAPPDGCIVGGSRYGHDFGDFELGQACRTEHGPSMVLCGHIHAPQCWQARVGQTLVLNPGHATDAPYPNHIVLDFDRGEAQLRRHGHRHEAVLLSENDRLVNVLKERRETPDQRTIVAVIQQTASLRR